MYNNLVKKFDAIQPVDTGTQKLVKLKRKLLIMIIIISILLQKNLIY